MKIWLDDIRQHPYGWERAYTAFEAIHLLKTNDVDEISLDHDLGEGGSGYMNDDPGTGLDVARFIESAAFCGELPRLKWHIHTANPVGRLNMKAALENADVFWSDREKFDEELINVD